MNKNFTFIKVAILVLTIIGLSILKPFAQEVKNGIIEGTIRIKLKPDVIKSEKGIETYTSKGIAITGIKSLDKVSASYSVTSIKRVFPYSPKFEERHMKHGLHLWYEVTYSAKATSNELVNAYAQVPEVEKSEVIHLPVLVDGGGTPRYVTSPSKDVTRPSEMPFNDPYLKKQWHYNNYGQTGGTVGADINLFNAWNTTHGTPNVVIAIMDQGVDYKHEDLHNMMWVNQAELNGTTGVDDDGNGFKDDIYGVNFAENNGHINIDYHGTHVAGTIAAENNNGIGVCGVAGGSGNGDGVRIMTCQILGGSRAADIPGAYVYAADMGAVISQNSWGYTNPGQYDEAVNVGIDYFNAEAGNYAGSPMKGGVVIFASGNSNTQEMMYPGAYEHVIAVDALTSRANRAVYSNYGDWTDISAPGGEAEDDAVLGAPAGFSNGIMSTLNANGYGYLDGTSMACPHVSGIAGLVVSQYGGIDFTNEMLTTHLLTGVRYLYNITGNESLMGKLGAGYIDAVLALAKDNKIAPNPIANLTLTGIAQDFATLSWSVPADEDDGIPLSFEILYSKVEINANTIANANILTLKNIKTVGENQIFEIKNLQSVTNYYFAVRSFDRWGNVSDFSNIIADKTNSGPITSFDPNKTALNITINASQNAIGKDSIKLFNTGEGMLRWNALYRNKVITPLSVRPNLQYPQTPNSVIATPHVLSNTLTPSALNSIQRDTLIDKGYVNIWVSLKVFGESNKTIPNSSATRFYVSEEEGFNLTDIDAYLQWNDATGPAIVEIYKGYDISQSKLLYAQEITKCKQPGYTGAKLNEQIPFEKGDYFWIVIHIPLGNTFCLGGGLELSSEQSKNCYYSNDVGKTWKLFEDIYDDNRVVWAVFATSALKNIDKYIVLKPDSGVVASNQNVSISAKIDATNIINGTYNSNLVVSTNETGKPFIRLPINATITGHKPVIQSVKRNDFGGVIVGNSKDIKVTIKNAGLGRFNFVNPYCNITNPQFSFVSGVSPILESGGNQILTFRFSPTIAGNIYAIVTLLDANNNNYTFELFGAGLEAPVAKLNPSIVTFNNLALGDSIVNSIYLSNKGKYPLDYFMPSFANGSNMESIPTDIQKFAYSYQIDTVGTTYVWNDISTTGKDITSTFVGNDMHNIYTKVQLNFLFPYYGKNENSVFISKYGVLAFINNNTIWSRQPLGYKTTNMPDKYISGCGFPMQTAEAGFGKILYKQEADKLIVQYEDCPFWEGVDYINNSDGSQTTFRAAITFQIVLYDNGNINMYYKQSSLQAQWTMIAMEDKTTKDGLLILGKKPPKWDKLIGDFKYQNHSAIHIYNPGLGLFSNISNPFGTILPGDSTKIKYTIKTDSLFLLAYQENLVMVTNDPVNNPTVHKVNFNIISGGISNINADTTGFDFGTIFKDGVKKNSFTVYNDGRAIDSLKTATFDNGYYTLTGNVPEILKPERRVEYSIAIKTNTIGVHNDTLRLTTTNGQVIKLALSGEVIQGPILNLQTTAGSSLTSITKFLTAGNSTTQNFKIKNTGTVNLNVAPVNNEWASVSESTTSTNEFGYSYKWKSSKDYGGPTYEWVEIAGDGGTKIEGLDSWSGPEWASGVKLPFTFDYYGNSYDTLFIGLSGLVTFTKDQNDINYFMGSTTIPYKGQPNNFIAPLFIFGGPDWIVMYPLAGPWYKVESDRVIVEYRDYNSAFTMGDPISYEVILYKNGNIKFQYVMPVNTSNTVTNNGVIGIENSDGTDGVLISDHQLVVNANMSIMLYPVRTYAITPGNSKDFTLNLSAKELVANTYADSMQFISNDPLALNKKLPIKIVVSGTPQIQKPDSIAFGNVMVNSKVPTITKEFEVKNTGSANFTISSATSSLYSSIKIEVYTKSGDYWFWALANASGVFPQTVVAKSSLKFRATITPTTPVVLSDVLQLTTSLATPAQNISITARIYNPPVLKFAQDTISYFAQTSAFKITHKLALDNLGGYPLNYKLNLDYLRDTTISAKSTSVSMANRLISNDLLPLISPMTKMSQNQKSSAKDGFNRILSYDNATTATNRLGYGGTRVFYVGTGFTAPAEGFNLTHVQTWYIPGEWLNSHVGVQIYGGDNDINNCKLLSSESFDHIITSVDETGSLLTFKLTKNIEFFPNEKFFVVFVYESAVTYPQGCIPINNNVANRFVFGAGDGVWYDLSAYSQFSTLGFMVRAAEETASSKPWVILSSADSSTVAPAKADTLQLNFDAQSVKNGDNWATLTATSNDLINPTQSVVLHLRRNAGPEFEIPSKLSVSENGTLNFSVVATDIEGDDFSVALETSYPFLNIVSITKSAGTKSSGFTPLVKTINIQYKPDFTCQGTQSLNITGTDAKGNVSTGTIAITVKNVNRPPVAIALDTIKLEMNGNYVNLYPNTAFYDPDNDIQTMSAISNNPSIANLFNSGSNYLLMPMAKGKTFITFIATDLYGATATNVVQVSIRDKSTGIDVVNTGSSLKAYPNPTSGLVNVVLPSETADEFIATLSNNVGMMVGKVKITKGTTSFQLDLAGLPNGLYILSINGNSLNKNIKLIKE